MRYQLLAVTCLAAAAPSALASIWTFNDTLSGAQENPPVTTPATGTVFGTYDDEMNMLMISLSSEGYTTNTLFAHIHRAPVGSNGPVLFNLPGPFGATTYNFTDFMVMFSEAQEADFLAGNLYVNVHTSRNPGGELRAQLNPVPTPGALALLGIGGLAAARRRR
jgi:hypothetical protein